MNKLILEILPQIEVTARKATRITDQQNELRQFTIIKCYEYEDVVKRLHKENNLDGWLYRVIRNEFLLMLKNEPTEKKTDAPDEEYFEFDLEKFKPYLTYAEQMWIKAYKECGGKYAEIERQKNITKKVCRLRILAIIEKCKQLKRILY